MSPIFEEKLLKLTVHQTVLAAIHITTKELRPGKGFARMWIRWGTAVEQYLCEMSSLLATMPEPELDEV